MSILNATFTRGFCNIPVLNALRSMFILGEGKRYQSKNASIQQMSTTDFTKSEHLSSELLQLRKAVEASGEVIFLTDREGTITYINPEFTRLYGFEPIEVVGKTTPRILKSGLMKPQDYEQFWNKLVSKQNVKIEFVNKCKDGAFVIVEGSANPIIDDQENIIGFLAIQRDVTKRKQADQALESAIAFQQSILDGIADPIMVIDTDYQVELMNHAAQKFSFDKLESPQPLLCYQVSHRRNVPCGGLELPCPFVRVQNTGRTVMVEHKHYLTNGEQRVFEVVASPLLDSDGSFQGIIESMRDISERVQTKEKLQRYTERLRALAAQIAEVGELERQRLAQELHDQVGQNLTALGINLNIIRTHLPVDVDKDVHFHLDDSVMLVEQTTEQIRNMLAELRPPVLDDYGLVAALRWYGDQFTKRTEIAVTIVSEKPFPRLAARVENSLFRIAQEAMTNVAKHAQATQLTVKIDCNRQVLHMVITDNGIGFDPVKLDVVSDGSGWGLLNINEQAEALGGECSVVSAPGKGTLVIVDVPR